MNDLSPDPEMRHRFECEFIKKLLSDIKLFDDMKEDLVPFDHIPEFNPSIPCEIDDKRDTPIVPITLDKMELLQEAARCCRLSSRRRRQMSFFSRAVFVFETLGAYLQQIDTNVHLRLYVTLLLAPYLLALSPTDLWYASDFALLTLRKRSLTMANVTGQVA